MSGDRRQQQQANSGQAQSGGSTRGSRQQQRQNTRQQQQSPQYQQGYGQGYSGGSGLGKYAIFGVGVFLGLALTTLLSLFLYYKLSPESVVVSLPFAEGGGAQNFMLVATIATFGLVAMLSAVVGLGVGVFSGRQAEAQTSAPLAGVIPAAAGSAAALFALIMLLFLVVPSGGGNQIGKLFAPALGVIMGTAAAGALGGFLGDRTTDW